MSWAERRTTKREEDAAYALLGIFEITMPLIYGEGQAKAFYRLRKEIKESEGDQLPRQASGPKPFSTVPFARDADFVDRSEISDWIREKLAAPVARAAIVGLGGVG